MGQQGGSVYKDTCCQTWQLGNNPWDPYEGRKETVPTDRHFRSQDIFKEIFI